MQDSPAYHSKFGGLWIDRADWREQVQARNLSEEQAGQVESFAEKGYIILEGAVDVEKVDAFQQRIAASFQEGNPDVLFQANGSHEVKPLIKLENPFGVRVVDAFVPFEEALELFASPRLLRFLALIFDENPLLFQSLSFDQGSQQGFHQDTAYVVVDRPVELAACWIALEDVKPGSGELMYVPGSHRLPDWDFGGGRKYWSPELDGPQAHDQWSHHLFRHSQESPHGVQYFLPKKGDVLIWHADLVHGGARVRNRKLTRQSLVGHFCSQSRRPNYFALHPHLATIRHHGSIAYCSQHYNLAHRFRSKAALSDDTGAGPRVHLPCLATLRRMIRQFRSDC